MLNVVFALVGVVLVAVGYVIKRYQFGSTIAGYDTRRTADKAGLTAGWGVI